MTYNTYDTYDGGLQKILTSTVGYGTSTTYQTQWAYDKDGNLTTKTLPDTSYLTYTYDAARRVTNIQNANGEHINYPAAKIDALGDIEEADTYTSGSSQTRKQTFSYDGLGHLASATTWQSASTSIGTTNYTYDGQGNLLTITDPRGHTTNQTPDALNRIYLVQDRKGNYTTTTFDAHDRATAVQDRLGHSTYYTREGFGYPIQITSPDSGATVYNYDLAGNVTKKTDSVSNATGYTYDALNRMLTKTLPPSTTPVVAYSYDGTSTPCGSFSFGSGVGRLTAMVDVTGTTSSCVNYYYDERGYVYYASRTYGVGTFATTYYYDGAGRLQEVILPDTSAQKWIRDSAGQVQQVLVQTVGGSGFTSVVGSSSAPITHAPFGPATSLPFYNGVTRTTVLDCAYRPASIKDVGTSSNILDLQYGYDANGNVAYITDNATPANTQGTLMSPITYDYDDQLLSASTVSGAGGYGTNSYTYDANGNIASIDLASNTIATGSNQLTAASLFSYTFPTYQAGNIAALAASGTVVDTFNYDQWERMASVTPTGSSTPFPTFVYDGFGQRLVKGATTITGYFYGPLGDVMEEYNSGGSSTDYLYLDPASPQDAFYPVGLLEYSSTPTPTSNVYYIHADRIGVPEYVTDASQSKPWSMTFYPFGVTFSSTGTFNQNLRLPGMIFDTETGLYHDGAREYSPELGRYFQTDPIGLDSGSTNTYAYANNNPLRLIDTSGTFSYISAGVRDAIDNLTPTASPFSGLTIAGTLSDAKTIDNAAFFARLAGLPIKDNPVATVCLGLADAYSTYQMALTQHSYAGLAATYAGLANVAALIGSEIYSIAATAWEVAFPHPQPEDLSHPYELAFPAPILPLVHTRQ